MYEAESSDDLKTHMNIHDISRSITWDPSTPTAATGSNLNNHTEIKHVQESVVHQDNNSYNTNIEEPTFICGQCGEVFHSEQECSDHLDYHMHKCYKCPFESQHKNEVLKHEETEHGMLQGNESSPDGDCGNVSDTKQGFTSMMGKAPELNLCEFCGEIAQRLGEIWDHQCNPHVTWSKCDNCDFVSNQISDIMEHIRVAHKDKHQCHFCDYSGVDRGIVMEHMMNQHLCLSMLNTVANQLTEKAESFSLLEVFKKELKDILNKLIDGQNVANQELFVLRNSLKENTKRIEDIDGALKHFSHNSKMEPTLKVSQPSRPSPPPVITSCSSTIPVTSSTPRKPPPSSSTTPPPPKILFVGDSISSVVELKAISHATKHKIVTAKAYTAKYDDVSSAVKDPARFPEKNFLSVVPEEVSKDKFEHVIIQSGACDITNLKTNMNPERYVEYFKQETIISARNIFTSGVITLQQQPSIKSVIIMKQIPRYDPSHLDPLSLKPMLSQLFNNTLVEEWMNSPLKDRIFIGTHNIECSGAVQSARYRHTKTGRFDGVHLYGSSGSKAYTKSMLNILQSASLTTEEDIYHTSCPQARYQQSRHAKSVQLSRNWGN